MKLRTERKLADKFDAIRVSTQSANPALQIGTFSLPDWMENAGKSPAQVLVSRNMPTSQIRERTDTLAESVRRIATMSKRLKEMYVRQVKEAAASLEDVTIISSRMDSGEEIRRLETIDKKLADKVAELREMVSAIHKEKNAVQIKTDSVLKKNQR